MVCKKKEKIKKIINCLNFLKEKSKDIFNEDNREIFINFFSKRFYDHFITKNSDYMYVWIERFNKGSCYFNADSKSREILKKLNYEDKIL